MAKVRIAEMANAAPATVPAPAERIGHAVETRALFDRARDPIHARLHRLPPHGTLMWQDSPMGFLAYVWEGDCTAGGAALAAGSAIIVEHGAAAGVTAGGGGAAILVFNRPAGAAMPSRAGGHVHLLPAERVPRAERLGGRAAYGAAILADSACPTCELWLHESLFHEPDAEVARHAHNEDEIIVVTGGEIVLGARRFGRGTAIAIAADTIYGFRTGPEGLAFINFRPSHPTYVAVDGGRSIDEQALYSETLGRPPYLAAA